MAVIDTKQPRMIATEKIRDSLRQLHPIAADSRSNLRFGGCPAKVEAFFFLPRGTCVWEDRSGRFRTEEEYRSFLAQLPAGLDKVVVDWAFVDDYKKNSMAVYMDFSETAMLNHGFSRKSLWCWERLFPFLSDKKIKANLEGRVADGSWHMFTSRDVLA
jgi:hypothetical protein